MIRHLGESSSRFAMPKPFGSLTVSKACECTNVKSLNIGQSSFIFARYNAHDELTPFASYFCKSGFDSPLHTPAFARSSLGRYSIQFEKGLAVQPSCLFNFL